MLSKWDNDFLALCQWWADRRSKDPSTKVGAVAVRSHSNDIVGIGYNGFAPGMSDANELLIHRDKKYPRTIHAEANALASVPPWERDLTLYVAPLFPCMSCAALIIRKGVKRVVCSWPKYPHWSDTATDVLADFKRAGVKVDVRIPATIRRYSDGHDIHCATTPE